MTNYNYYVRVAGAFVAETKMQALRTDGRPYVMNFLRKIF